MRGEAGLDIATARQHRAEIARRVKLAQEARLVGLLRAFLGLGVAVVGGRGRGVGAGRPGHQRQAPPAAATEVDFFGRWRQHRGALGIVAPAQVDRAVLFQLARLHETLAHAFQRRDQHAGLAEFRRFATKVMLEGGGAFGLQRHKQLLHTHVHRHFVQHHAPRAEAVDACHDQLVGTEQGVDVEVLEADLLVGVGVLGDGLAQLTADAAGGVDLQPVEQRRGVLEAAIGEQALDEVGPWVEDLVGLLGDGAVGGLGRGRQQARLHLEQGRRHDDEVAGDVEVEVLPQVDGGDELVGDGRDRDLDDVEFGPPYEV